MFAVKAAIGKVRFRAKFIFDPLNKHLIGCHYLFSFIISIKYRDAQYFKHFAYGGFAAAYIAGYTYFKHYFLIIKSIFCGSTFTILLYDGMRVIFTGRVV